MTTMLPTLTDEDVSRWRSADADDGFGTLTTEKGPLPLKELDVRARVAGLIAEVAVRQTFVNTHSEPLEATYIFPLPDRAAVTRFRLEVAGRVVEGQLKERGAARKEYDSAIRAGHRAAITEEERPGVFTMRVGNLPPGESATVHLTLAGPLPYADGEATFRFPLVVAPRYIPGVPLPGPSVGDGVAPDTDAVPDASRISPPVLLPGFPNPVRLSLSVDFPESDLQAGDFRASLHTVQEESGAQGRRFVLQPGERLDRDFVLRFRVAGGQVRTSLAVQPDGQGDEGTFALTLVPPTYSDGAVKPRDIVFVLDRSGSMDGWKMVAARRALARMVEALTDRDRFTVLAFDDRIETPPSFDGLTLVAATDRRRYQAAEFLAKIESRGGTEMAQPLDAAVRELTRESGDRDRILVLVTDGQVGNEDQILKNLGKRLRGVRVFTLGIDTAVNAAFLKRLADLGGGASDLVESEARLDEVMDGLHRRIGAPVLTNLRIEPFKLEVMPGSVTPARLPDLFAGVPVMIYGRYRGAPKGSIAVRATDAAGKPWSSEAAPRTAEVPALSAVWARGSLREMEDRYAIGADRETLEKQIVRVSLRFGVLCRFTSFVAVDRAAVVNAGGEVHQVTQPVEMPAGWEDQLLARSCLSVPPTGAMPPAMFCASMPCPPAAAAMDDTTTTDYDPGEPDMDRCMEMAEDEAAAPQSAPSSSDRARAGGAASAAPAQAPSWKARTNKLERQSKKSTGGSWIERLLDWFRGTPELPTLDREPFRQRVREILRELRETPAVGGARLAFLLGRSADLQALFRDLMTGGDRHSAVAQLGEALLSVEALSQSVPDDTAIGAAWAAIETALSEYLGEKAETAAPQREGFWK